MNISLMKIKIQITTRPSVTLVAHKQSALAIDGSTTHNLHFQDQELLKILEFTLFFILKLLYIY